MGPLAGMNAWKKTLFPLLVVEPRFLGRPFSCKITILSYPGSVILIKACILHSVFIGLHV